MNNYAAIRDIDVTEKYSLVPSFIEHMSESEEATGKIVTDLKEESRISKVASELTEEEKEEAQAVLLSEETPIANNIVSQLPPSVEEELAPKIDNLSENKQQIVSKLQAFKASLATIINEKNTEAKEDINENIIQPMAQAMFNALYNGLLKAADDPRGPYYDFDRLVLWPMCETYVFPYVKMFGNLLILLMFLMLLMVYMHVRVH